MYHPGQRNYTLDSPINRSSGEYPGRWEPPCLVTFLEYPRPNGVGGSARIC